MARIQVFQGGSVQRDAPQVTPFRAPDFGPGIGPGIEKLGQGLGEAASAVDQIQDIHARVEANKFSIAHNNLATTISERVRSTLGDGAQAAADKGYDDLKKGTDTILSEASPRARKILETEFAKRNTEYQQQWWEHGFDQTKQAFDTSSQAANDKDLEAALQQSTDQAAAPYLDSIRSRNRQRSSFFGLGSAWEAQENSKAVSSYYKSRALTLGVNSASDAIKYAMQHRTEMGDGDFSSIVRTYRDESLNEQAEVEALGYDRNGPSDAPTVTHDDGTTHKGADPKLVFNGLIVPNEGSAFVAHDSNGAPVKYGINQKANPDVDVANLTAAGAQKLFIDRTWKPSGADRLPPALAAIHADTYYLNPSEATKILRKSGGDVQKYIELRSDFLAALHASNPAKYPDYTKRNERVEQYAASLGGDGTPFSFSGHITDKTSMSATEDEVMARKDLPLALKTRIIRVVRERREMLRSDRRADEEDARDDALNSITKLGDKFTSIKQIPAEDLPRLSAEALHSYTEMAKTNRYKRDDSALRPDITFTMVTDPQRFMSKDYILQLMRKGASPELVTQVQTEQEGILKKQMNAKPDVISDGTLWGTAKPAFEAAGIGIDKTLLKTPAGKQRAAAEQQQAVGFLQKEATEWANDNPGKRPTPEIMHQWIGAALLKTRSGSFLFQANDADVYNSIPDNVRSVIVRDLRRGGVTSQGNELVADVANYYRKLRSVYGTGPIALGTRDGSIQAAPMRGSESPTDALSDQ